MTVDAVPDRAPPAAAAASPPLPGAQPAPRPGAVPVLAIAGLALAALASGVSLRLTDALLPRLSREFGIPLGQASLVITVFAVAYGVSQTVFGPLGDRFGKYRVIGLACGASALTSLVCALAPGFHWLLLGRLVAGISAAGIIPLAMAWIGDVVPYAQRQPVLARFLIGQISGFALGVWAGGFAAEHLDWRAPFFGVAGLFALMATLLQGVRRRLPATAVQPAAAPRGAVLATLVHEFRAVLSRRWARVVVATVAAEGAAVFGAFAFVAAHLHQRFGLPLSTVGALVMLFALGGLGFALSAQTLVRRLGEALLVRLGGVFIATALLALAVAPAWAWAMPACVLMGLGFYMLHNTLQTQATQMAPERRGAAVAAFAACFFLGQSAGVGLAGLLVGRLGTGWVLATGAAGALVVSWNFNRLRRSLARGAPAAVPVA